MRCRTRRLAFDRVEQAYVGYVYGGVLLGHRAVAELGLTGIPIFNVNSNCSTGSTALYLGAQAVRSGQADCVLALGFEKMQPRFARHHVRRPRAADGQPYAGARQISEVLFPPAPWMFGAAGREHMKAYGTRPSTSPGSATRTTSTP